MFTLEKKRNVNRKAQEQVTIYIYKLVIEITNIRMLEGPV